MKSLASKPIAAISAAFLTSGLAACAVSGPATIQSSSGAVQTISAVEFPALENDGTLRSQWSAALARSFAAKSVKIEQSAPYIADFALAVREAQSGVAKSGDAGGEVEWQSSPRDNRLLDICKAKRLRGSLIIFDRHNGAIAYKGHSEAAGCGFGPEDFDGMAMQLVADALK